MKRLFKVLLVIVLIGFKVRNVNGIIIIKMISGIKIICRNCGIIFFMNGFNLFCIYIVRMIGMIEEV